MKKSRLLGAVCAVLFVFISVSANASLVSRLDGQAAYDDVLNITWTTNAALSGSHNWDNQMGFVRGLNTANYLGFDGWRLASLSVTAGLPTGTTTSVFDCGASPSTTEPACRDNELGYMYWQNMGGTGSDKTGNQTVDGVLLANVQPYYWSGTEFSFSGAWYFFFLNSQQGSTSKGLDYYGWVVADGDIGATPIPPSVWLFGSGLLGLIGIARKKAA
jgi:hypothetical protein